MRQWLSRYLFLPATSVYSDRMYFKALRYKSFLEKTQFWEPQAIEDLRNEQFHQLVCHCYNHVPYYRRYMDNCNLVPDDFQSIADVVKFPVLEKEFLNKNLQQFVATNLAKNDIRYETTGGTTGTPTLFGVDVKNYYRVHANAWRMWEYVGYVFGMKTLLFWGNRLELDRATTFREKIKSLIENTKMLNFYDFSQDQLEPFADFIKKYKPDIIRGFAGTIYLFAELCKKKHITFDVKPKAIILTSENIFSEHKRNIADFFGCDVYEEYGAREFGNMAHECKSHQGLHLAEELFLFEIFNPLTKKSQFVGKGEILITCLFNYAMPLIRYRIEDEVTISPDVCACGRNLKLIQNIEGRIADYVITNSKRFVHQGIFNNLFYSSRGILMYQVQQYELGKAVIYVVRDKNFNEQVMKKLETDFKKMYKNDLTITLKYVDNIQVSSSGKRRAVISHIAPDYLQV